MDHRINSFTSDLPVNSFAQVASQSEPSVVTLKIMTEWEKLMQYTNQHKEEGYFLRFLVKQAHKKNMDDASRFQSLFSQLERNLFGGRQFLPLENSCLAADYIQAELKLRDFDLKIFWNCVHQEHPHLNLPDFEKAQDIRSYFQENQEKIHQITILQMQGIFEVWSKWHEKYGDSLGLPFFETEEEIHDYLENPKNMGVVVEMVKMERETIIEKTTRLPPEIKFFKNLETITFSNRRSLTLPKAIFKLEKLKVLNICHSELHKLSKQVALLTNLQKLCLIGTEFARLPESIKQLNNAQIKIENKTKMNLSSSMESFLDKRANSFPDQNENLF